MTNTGFDTFDSSIQTSIKWIDDVNERLGRDDREHGYTAMRAVLHTLRDRLTVEESSDLAAQLPMMIRGMYYDGWNPAGTPVKLRDREEFMEYMRDQLGVAVNDLPADDALEAVLLTLHHRISPGQLQDMHRMLPEDLQHLWAEKIAG